MSLSRAWVQTQSWTTPNLDCCPRFPSPPLQYGEDNVTVPWMAGMYQPPLTGGQTEETGIPVSPGFGCAHNNRTAGRAAAAARLPRPSRLPLPVLPLACRARPPACAPAPLLLPARNAEKLPPVLPVRRPQVKIPGLARRRLLADPPSQAAVWKEFSYGGLGCMFTESGPRCPPLCPCMHVTSAPAAIGPFPPGPSRPAPPHPPLPQILRPPTLQWTGWAALL